MIIRRISWSCSGIAEWYYVHAGYFYSWCCCYVRSWINDKINLTVRNCDFMNMTSWRICLMAYIGCIINIIVFSKLCASTVLCMLFSLSSSDNIQHTLKECKCFNIPICILVYVCLYVQWTLLVCFLSPSIKILLYEQSPMDYGISINLHHPNSHMARYMNNGFTSSQSTLSGLRM